jgi:hypothetical protein
MPLRNPAEILDAVAARQQYVTPLQEHMPLSPAMARACVRDAYAEVLRLMQWAGADATRLKSVRDELARASAHVSPS